MNGKRVDAGLVAVKLDLRRYGSGKSFSVLRVFP